MLPSLLLCIPSNGDQWTSMASLLCLHVTQSMLFVKGKCAYIVPVLGFADNVLCHLTLKMRGDELWEHKGRQPGSVALFLCLGCQLLDN